MTRVCEHKCAEVCVCATSRKTDVTVPLAVWYERWRDKESAETRANDEDPGNRLLNKSKTILI